MHKLALRCLLITCFVVLALAAPAFAQQPFNKSEFVARRAKLFEKIPDGLAVIFGAKGQHYPVKFRQSPDFYYLTGVEEPGAVLVLIGSNKSSFLFVPRRSDPQIRADGPGIWQMEKREEVYGLTRVQPIEEFLPMLQFFPSRAKNLYMLSGSQGNVQNARDELDYFETLEGSQSIFGGISEAKKAISVIQQIVPQLALHSLNPLLDEMRWIKSPSEIELTRKSAEIAAEGVKEAMKGTQPGMYEYEIEAAARFVYTKRGARGDAFRPIVASGPNTMILHYSANNRKMLEGEVVYMDYGADYEYYTSDITRTWPVSGRFTPEQEKMYRCILEARDAIIAAMKPGVTISQLQDVSGAVYKKHGYEKEFLALGRYIGHTIGISVHDVSPPDRNRPFEAGVVFNVEPLLEIPEKKIHMRLEDTVLVTPTGAVNMTAGVPASLDEIYALIRQRALSINR
ncbi:MAG TPA: Xaa-Pro peptidase family protein [Pyrinomonadaceae bacterium]|nr:Xaa-Pro peptidase family protein [Pyrinomonadaceae bacterium]